MRLLHTTSFTLNYFAGGPPPRYVILSHRWENEEVLFEHIRNGVTGQVEAMQGFTKVKGSCAMARSQGYDYIWIDTCCIDKSSSAELSEAINSMFNWYRQATVCYAYLSDADELTWSRSHWFTRGWTLQELIAPSWVFFFDRDWDFIGDKSDFSDDIGTITGIPSAVLTHWDSQASRCELCHPGARGFVRVGPGIEPCSHNREDNLSKILDSCSVAQKLSWASRRETTRIEDTAYCLLGLFGVNMPLLYGEGLRAFVRLQEEIIKISDDQSILAFDRTGPEWPFEGQDSLLAESPHYFAGLGKIRMTTPAETTLMTPTAKTLETQVWMCRLIAAPSMMHADLWLALILEAVDPMRSIFRRVWSNTTVIVTPETSRVKLTNRHGIRLAYQADPSLEPLGYNVDEAVLTNIRLLLRSSKTKPRDDFRIKDGKLHIQTDQSCHVSFLCPISKADDLYSTDARPLLARPIIGGDRYIYQVRAFVALETSWDVPIWVLCGNRERDSHDRSRIPWCRIIDENTMAEIGLIAGKDTASGPVGKHMWPTKAQFEKDIWENRKAWECLLGFITNHEGANEKSQSRQTRSYSEGDSELKRTTDITATVIAKTFLGVPATVLEVFAVKTEVEFVD